MTCPVFSFKPAPAPARKPESELKEGHARSALPILARRAARAYAAGVLALKGETYKDVRVVSRVAGGIEARM